MKFLLSFFLAFIFLGCSNTQLITSRPKSNYKFSVLQGSTTSDATLIRVIYPKKLQVEYTVTNSDKKTFKVTRVKSFSKKHSVFKVEHIKVTGLSLSETYTLKITSDNKRWNDVRTFKALDTKKNNLKILVASCMSDSFNEIGNDIWPKAFSKKPDVTFLIGDNLYAETYAGKYLGKDYPAAPAHLWNRHVDHAMTLKLNRMDHLTPTYATWDDHDYGKNDGNKTFSNTLNSGIK